MNTTPRLTILLFVVTASLPLFAADALPLNLGSGDPHLRIIYNGTNQYVIYLDKFWSVSNYYFGQYPTRRIQVLTDRNFGLKEMVLSGAQVEDVQPLFPFDELTAFTCEGGPRWSSDYKTFNYWPRKSQVFSSNSAGVVMLDEDVYALAWSRYGLTTNELFLGKIGTNIFYWEPPNPRRVFYRNVEEKHAKNYFKLPKGVLDICGVMKAASGNKDVGFQTVNKAPRFFGGTADYVEAFIEVSFKDAKQVKGSQ